MTYAAAGITRDAAAPDDPPADKQVNRAELEAPTAAEAEIATLRAALAVETARNRELTTALQKLRDILRDLTGTFAPTELEFAA